MLDRKRLDSLLAALEHGLLERETPVRLALLAALGAEHLLLIGPPGTAKSALARRLHRAFAGTRYFERLLTRFSTPEELFGPLSLKALEDDRYERLTDGFLPTAGIAFLDEVFKANSAILNALLTLLNERAFDNGTQRVNVPLVCVIGATNEVPEDESLQAFHDRFLVRVPVAPVGDEAFAQLLALDDELPTIDAPLQSAECVALRDAAARVALDAGFVDGCRGLRNWLAGAELPPLTDRRWRRFVGLARVAAASEGRAEVDRYDLWLAPYVAAARPEDVPPIQTWFERDWLASPPAAAPWLERAVQAFEQQLRIEVSAPAEDAGSGDGGAGKLALARRIGVGQRADNGDDLDGSASAPMAAQRIVSARLEAAQRRHYSAVHIEARVAQVREIETQVAAERAVVQAQADAQAHRLADRLWMPPGLRARLARQQAQALSMLDAFAGRLAAARAGFAALPRDDSATDAQPPEPVAMVAPTSDAPTSATDGAAGGAAAAERMRDVA